MQVNISIKDDDASTGGVTFPQLIEKVDVIMADQKQLAEDLKSVQAQIDKIGNETTQTLQKVKDLEQAVIQAGQTTPEVDAAIKALKDQAQLVDDMVADPETPPSEGAGETPTDGGGEAPADGGTTPPADGGGEAPAPAPTGGEPAPAPTEGEPAPAPADGSTDAGATDGTGARAAGGTIDRVTGQVRR